MIRYWRVNRNAIAALASSRLAVLLIAFSMISVCSTKSYAITCPFTGTATVDTATPDTCVNAGPQVPTDGSGVTSSLDFSFFFVDIWDNGDNLGANGVQSVVLTGDCTTSGVGGVVEPVVPPGEGLGTCTARYTGTSLGRAVTVTLSATWEGTEFTSFSALTITFGPAGPNAAQVAQKTQQTIQRYLARRNDMLLAYGPNLNRRIWRLPNGTPASGGSAGLTDNGGQASYGQSKSSAYQAYYSRSTSGYMAVGSRMAALGGPKDEAGLDQAGDRANSPENGGAPVSFSASLVDLAKRAGDARRQRLAEAAGAGAMGLDNKVAWAGSSGLDFWVQGTFANFDSEASGSKSEGEFHVLYVGADYLVGPDLLIGALYQYDSMEELSPALETRVEGHGWMAGPYVTLRALENVYLNARAAWGRSDNDISPLLTYEDTFETERWLVEGSVQGYWAYGAWLFNPGASVAYVEDHQKGYTDSLGNDIPGQTVTLGQARLSPRIAYAIMAADGTYLEPSISLEGIWNFEESGTSLVAATLAGQEELRGKIELGLRALTVHGLDIDARAGYDGIGVDDFEAYTGELRVRLPLN